MEPQPNSEAGAAPSLTIITHFTQKLVEKLYSGMFSADPRHILLFITEHIMVVRTPLAVVVWKLPTGVRLTCCCAGGPTDPQSSPEAGPAMGGRKEQDLHSPGRTWWLWGSCGLSLRPSEIRLSGQEPRSPMLAPELCPLLDSIMIVSFILIVVILHQQRKGRKGLYLQKSHFIFCFSVMFGPS